MLSGLLAVLIGVAGCQSKPLRSGGKISGLNLITVPVALDLDKQPGPDGVSVKVYATTEGKPKPVPLAEGSLELLMFDGPFQRFEAPPPVLKRFQFTPETLRRSEFRARIGTGYQFYLDWGTNLPTHHVMSVAGRYTRPDGTVITSRPSSVTVLSK